MSQSEGFAIELRVFILCLPSTPNTKNILEEMSGIVRAVSLKNFPPPLCEKSRWGFYRNSHNLVLNRKPIMSLIEQYFLMTGAVYNA